MRAVAAHGLPGTTLALPPGPLDGPAWAGLLRDAEHHRLVGLLAAAVAAAAPAVTPAQREQTAETHAVVMARVLDIEAAALGAVAVLDGAGVGVRVLKGLATAHLDMPDPAQREFGDVDLLVEPGSFRRAVDVLAAHGLARDLPERRAGFDERFGKEATLYAHRGVEVDLHRTLALGAFGLAMPAARLWPRSERFEVGGRELHALAPEARLLHACYSALLGDAVPRLRALRDVAQLAGRSDLDAGEVVSLAAAGRGTAVVAGGVKLAGETLGAGPGWDLWDWACSTTASRWERAALRAYESHGGTNTATLLSGWLALPPRAGLSYLRGLAFPDRAYVLARRQAGRPGEWASGWRELLRPAWPGRRARA